MNVPLYLMCLWYTLFVCPGIQVFSISRDIPLIPACVRVRSRCVINVWLVERPTYPWFYTRWLYNYQVETPISFGVGEIQTHIYYLMTRRFTNWTIWNSILIRKTLVWILLPQLVLRGEKLSTTKCNIYLIRLFLTLFNKYCVFYNKNKCVYFSFNLLDKSSLL